MIEERDAFLWLGGLRTLSPVMRQKLLELSGSAKQLLQAPESELMALVADGQLKQETMEEIINTRREEAVLRLAENYLKRGFPFLTPVDPEYPELLRNIPDPPVTLFYRGRIELLSDTLCIGVVGTRTPSLYGKEVAGRFVSGLASAGIVIVSGLAAGIDAEAHKSAIRSGGATIGVLGGGIDICYPRRNYGIYSEMCESQLVLSEYAPGVAPLAIQFPLRNRIISGLSEGLLVVEARKRSGSLITADAALEQGRSVYAVPGRLGDPLCEGTNNLIRQGAMCVMEISDILEDLGVNLKQSKRSRAAGQKGTGQDKGILTKEEQQILSKLSLVPVHVDELLDELLKDGDGNLQDILSLLLSLERRALIRQPVRGYYTLV